MRPNYIGWLLALAVFSVRTFAHDIPNDVLVQAFLHPSGNHLRLLVRVPLKSIRDIVFPERPAGYLDLKRAAPLLPDAAVLWISDYIELYEGSERLPMRPRVAATQLSLESDRSFASYDQALAHVSGPPLPGDTNVVWTQTMLDVLFEYPIRSAASRFSIHPALAHLGGRVVTVFRYLPGEVSERAMEFTGDPGLVRLDPRWHQAALQFLRLGFVHILGGIDHLLFLFCLVIPFRRFRALIPVVTAFTVAHSITLIASAYQLGPDTLWFPPLIETLIAISIVYMALENIVGAGTVQRRWIIALAFGLVHGFGFSFTLRQTLQLAGTHLLSSLLSFNVGVELGQFLVLMLVIPLLEALFRYVVAERVGAIILSAMVAHTGWHWMLERGARLRQYQFEWPAITMTFVASALRWLMAGLILGGMSWLVTVVLRRRARRGATIAADSQPSQ